MRLCVRDPGSRGEGRIAFTFGESGALRPSQLAVIDADGKNRRALPPYEVIGLSWSLDGRFIAYGSLGRYGVTTMNVDGHLRSRRVVRSGGSPDWSPDGRSIAFVRGGDLWLVNLDDRRQRRIVRHGDSPSWAPDGRKLAFERGRGQRCVFQVCVRRADVWVLNVAAKKERRLVRNAVSADWSPDGRQIVFERWRRVDQDFRSFIYVVRADGTAQRRLFQGSAPAWSPNGRELVFIGVDARRHYHDAVIPARLDGSRRRILFGQRPYCGCVGPERGPAPRRG